MHYMRWYTHGDPERTLYKMSIEERLAEYSVDANGCWIAKIYKRNLRPMIRVSGGMELTARAVLARKLGRDIRKGCVAAHTCDVGACINPDHIVEMTVRENVLDAVNKKRYRPNPKIISPQEFYILKPHKSPEDLCKRGHKFGLDNAIIQKAGHSWARACRKCRSAYQKQHKVKHALRYKVKNFLRNNGLPFDQDFFESMASKVANQSGLCYHCRTSKFDCFDHLTPKVRGGLTDIDNVVPSCTECNGSKGAKTFSENEEEYPF